MVLDVTRKLGQELCHTYHIRSALAFNRFANEQHFFLKHFLKPYGLSKCPSHHQLDKIYATKSLKQLKKA